MANTTLFSSIKSKLLRTDSTNEAGGRAYKFAPKHALAQLAATGCFNGTYYAAAETQLDELRKLIDQVDDNVFLAKLAVYSRERAFMKDMPAALLAVLSKRDSQLMHKVFDRVVDNGRVLRTLFQMIRSGQFGRTSLSSSLQRAFQRWLNEASVGTLLSASIGDKPSLRDVLRLARPTPKDNARRAVFGWLTGKEVEKWAPATEADLPEQVQGLMAYRKAESAEAQVLILGNLSVRWDTLVRHEVFSSGNGVGDSAMVDYVAGRIADAAEISRSRQFPYQFLAAYLNADETVPLKIKAALHQAAEIACGNVPKLPGPVLIGLDTSGSMGAAVTGNRGRSATSKMRTKSEVGREKCERTRTSHFRLQTSRGGGTDCSLPLAQANSKYAKRRFPAPSTRRSRAGAAQRSLHAEHARPCTVGSWQPSQRPQFLPARRVSQLPPERTDFRLIAGDLIVELGAVIVVERERRVDLAKRQMRVLEVHFFRTGPVSQLVQHQLNDFDVGVVDPGAPVLAQHDVACQNRCHG